jgi:hypothetical protein
VRVMKQRKTISHAELVAEVIGATRERGAVDVGDIKKNIDKYVDERFWRGGLQMLTIAAGSSRRSIWSVGRAIHTNTWRKAVVAAG